MVDDATCIVCSFLPTHPLNLLSPSLTIPPPPYQSLSCPFHPISEKYTKDDGPLKAIAPGKMSLKPGDPPRSIY